MVEANVSNPRRKANAMKARSRIQGTSILLGLLLFTSSASAQDTGNRPFEGILHVRFQTVDEVQFIDFWVKRERIRVEAAMAEPGGTYFLTDYLVKKRYVILPFREEYLEFPAAAVKEDPRQLKDPVNFEKTDSTDEVAGFPCDQLMVKTDDGELEIWATSALGTAGTLSTNLTLMLAEQSPWEKEIIRFGYFPLKVILHDGSGDQRVMFEAISIEKRTLGEARFLIPSGYEKTTVDALTPKAAPKKKTR